MPVQDKNGYWQMIIEDKVENKSMRLEDENKQTLVDFFLNWYLGRVILIDYLACATETDARHWIETIAECHMRVHMLNACQHQREEHFIYDLVKDWDGMCKVEIMRL